jgi:heme/copper-type cytochrome/quinol oxidase subunit 3
MRTVSSERRAVPELPNEERLGTGGMLLLITTEALLFVSLFFAYFYLGRQHLVWPPRPPKIALALVMLAVLAASSFVLHWGEKRLRAGRRDVARAAVGVTIALGLVFLALQFLEYRDHLRSEKPWSSSYASIFYTVTSVHGIHLIVGLLMLAFALALPRWEPRERSPHRPLHNASLYWHFVDTVWVFIVAFLYLLPRWNR